MREYKYVCKDCKEHLTNSEDRLCEWCRDKKRVNSAQICIICGKDVLLHGMVCVTTVVQRCLRSPINLACLGRKLLNGLSLNMLFCRLVMTVCPFKKLQS